MTEGNGRWLGSASSTGQHDRNVEAVTCPVCGNELKSLRKLNVHLDNVHGFNDESASDVDSSRESSVIGLNTLVQERTHERQSKGKLKMNTSHWKKPVEGKSVCFECGCKLNARNGMINCRKCGELFCLRHCRNAIKLNENGEYDPASNVWCKCCHKCYINRKGYNDYGLTRNITQAFAKIRKLKNEDGELITLQLENRLLRLINGIIQLHVRHQSSVFATFRIRAGIIALERSIVEWKDDQMATQCGICSQPFGLLMRKHHCRLCGQIVCDRQETRCSSDIPVLNLMSAAPDLSFENVGNLKAISDLSTGVRICSSCLRYVFAKRKLQFSKALKLPEILQQYENLHNLETLVVNLLPRFQKALDSIHNAPASDETAIQNLAQLRRKLLQNLTLYDKLSKSIVQLDTKSTAEKKIQQSIALHASAFIEEKMLPLKKIPEILNPVSQKVEVTTSSDLLFNNITIAEVKKYREELMVLNEQRYLVENMLNSAAKERRFEEAISLKTNLSEIDQNIVHLESKLGDEGF